MFKFSKSPALNELDEYLQLISDEPVRWLEREVKRWGDFTYDELSDLIASGDTQPINWQSRYAQVVNEKFNPLWLSAIQAASYAATRGRITIDDSDVRVKEFLRTRAAEFVQELSDESKRAVANVILFGQANRFAPRDIAQMVRPLIGLNSRQAQANVEYRRRVYNELIDAGLSPSTADTRAGTSASKYAAKQHRFRAETIVHTELARAYNRGAYDGVKAAIDAKLMSHCEMIWSTAGTNRVCGRCLSLKDTVVGHTNEIGVQLPPLHPRCRCVIVYRENSKPLYRPATNFTFDPQRFGVYETQIQSHGGSGNIKPDKIISGHDKPRTAEPLSIIDHLDKNSKIDKRTFYDENGRMYLEIHTTNHGNPKNHPFGSHGEHAHDVVWDGDKVKWSKGKELTSQERKDNDDIL